MGTLSPDKAVYVVDTTLRDGEQTAGVAFGPAEKLAIARLLDDVGVDQIEAGTPAMGGEEAEAVGLIAAAGLKASVMAWCRATAADIAAAVACGVDAVEISSPVSALHIRDKLRASPAAVLANTVAAVEFARKHGLYISVGMEDASRADEDFLLTYIRAVTAAGARRVRYCDTVGILDPLTMAARIERLRRDKGAELEVHAHNDFGMATANTVAAHRAGARFLSVTVNGLGERAGNAALEEVLMFLRHSGAAAGYNLAGLRQLCQYVAGASGRGIPAAKPVVGQAIFHHESGIHADGVLKNPALYEPFDPAEVGLERRIVVGKHSGKAALLHKSRELGLPLSEAALAPVAAAVKQRAVQRKEPVADGELAAIIREHLAC
ncbi:homocitrate synthase [Anaeroselena agilis]|uniref:Homocitrate synthase n=1 Tax=Anaeroselena agilis TaxID=3063788 RepID=A0ABU3NZB9_9FIRM|nr:homocitrate synthase [Selenomonadales bacterium 4137-cl]